MAHTTVRKRARSRSSRRSAGQPGAARAGRRPPPRPRGPRARTYSSIGSSSRACLRSAAATSVGQRPENWARPPETPTSRPRTATPAAVDRVEVEGAPLGGAEQLQRRRAADPQQVVDVLDPLVEHADRVEPPLDVHAAVGARHPDVLPDREGDLAPGARQLVGDLHPGGGTARRRGPARRPAARAGGSRWRRSGRGARAAPRRTSGRCGSLQAPVATTTARADHDPAVVYDGEPAVGRAAPAAPSPRPRRARRTSRR